MSEQEPYRRKEAAALAYDPMRDDAPIVVAAGSGIVAENILRTAQEHNVPVVPDQSLARVLNQLSVGDAIPPDLYAVVAQILIFVGKVDGAYAAHQARGG